SRPLWICSATVRRFDLSFMGPSRLLSTTGLSSQRKAWGTLSSPAIVSARADESAIRSDEDRRAEPAPTNGSGPEGFPGGAGSARRQDCELSDRSASAAGGRGSLKGPHRGPESIGATTPAPPRTALPILRLTDHGRIPVSCLDRGTVSLPSVAG